MKPRAWCPLGRVGLGLALAAGILGCAPRGGTTHSITATLQLVPPGPAGAALASLGPVTMAPLVDARPAASRTSRGPYLQSSYSAILGTQAFVFGTRTEGRVHHGSDGITLTLEGRTARPEAAVTELVRAILVASSGQDVRVIARPVALTSPASMASATGTTDGIVIVPILDQLDVTALSSKNTMSGGASYEESRTPTTITTRTVAGVMAASDATPTFANARVRLLVLRMQGGTLAASHVVYGRGAHTELARAIDDMTRGLQDGLVELFAPPPAPPAPEPPAPEPPAPEPAQEVPTTSPPAPSPPPAETVPDPANAPKEQP